ncbi:MAG: hypothetical protein CMD68_02765 [Gammaproteobacteria bacterium]|nr:hypothetical protein [Gammaproteobacteria bacterium]
MIFKNKIFLLSFFLIASSLFAKELPTLFEIKISTDQYTNTNDGLNKAFNRLIQKLTGSRNKKFLWKLGDSNIKKIDFVSSYSTEIVDDKEFLSVKFNSDILIPELRKIEIPLIGFNRPVLLMLLKVDNGESSPIYLDNSISSYLLNENIKKAIKKIALERGVYIELPEFDLEDRNLLNQVNILFSPSNYIQEKFYHDAFLSIEFIRIGVNKWSINGDIRSSSALEDEQVIEFFQNNIHNFLDNFLEVKPLEQGSKGEEALISINGLKTFQDFETVESELDKIFAIKSRTYKSFERSSIDYAIQLFQTKDSLIKELRGSPTFLIKKYNEKTNILELEYLNLK